MKSITLLCFYFGEFPEWAPIYFETLKRNSTINFIFYCDCDSEGFEAPNVIFKKTTLQEFLDKAYNKIGIHINSDDLYKLCDIAPMVGDIHFEDIKNSDYYGFCDLDILLGDIRSFYTDDILSKHDVFSTHENLLSGHFMLFRNTEYNRLMYKNIGGLKEKLESSFCLGLAESNLFLTYKKIEKYQKGFKHAFLSLLGLKKKTRFYLQEQFTTPFTDIPWLDGSIRNDHPNEWYYKNGKITNIRDLNRNFMYIHFANFKSNRYRHDGSPSPWTNGNKICFATKYDLDKGIVINLNGIYPF